MLLENENECMKKRICPWCYYFRIYIFFTLMGMHNWMRISTLSSRLFFGSVSSSESWPAEESVQDLHSCSQVRSSLMKFPPLHVRPADRRCLFLHVLFCLFSQYCEKQLCSLSFKVYATYPSAVRLCSRCPFLLNLDLIGIANHFAQLNLPAFALGTLLLIPSALKKEQQIHVSVSLVKSIVFSAFPTFICIVSLNSTICTSVSRLICMCFWCFHRASSPSPTQWPSSSRWMSWWTLES